MLLSLGTPRLQRSCPLCPPLSLHLTGSWLGRSFPSPGGKPLLFVYVGSLTYWLFLVVRLGDG